MNLILYNLGWMSWNILLALISMLLGKLSLRIKPKVLHFLFTLVFLLFIPNTVYIVTDLAHLFQRWNTVDTLIKVLLLVQYLLFVPIGFITFISSLRLLKMNLVQNYTKFSHTGSIFLLNFLIAFGVVIGRVQRANSWEVVTRPLLIIKNVQTTLKNPDLILYVLVLGVFCNLLYFAVEKRTGVGERT